jgi:phosphoribosylaminoimidazole-succinocarboxamide synthase
MPALMTASLPGMPRLRSGKVREVFDAGDSLLIVSTDRISAFDVVMANGIPDKGRVLNQMSAFWFSRLSSVCPHHVITTRDAAIAERIGEDREELAGRCTLALKADPLPIECVARGYLAGSLFKDYLRGGPRVHGLDLPEGLLESSRLPEPIFTPATKAVEGHDENLSFEAAAHLVGAELAVRLRDITLRLYRQASEYAVSRGIILADTKFEFGLADGELLWIDEALTPDSSRFWPAAQYRPGGPQPSFDKQFVRDYLESIGWDKRPPGPELPLDVVAKTREKYVEAFERLTGSILQGVEAAAPRVG